MSDVSKTVDIIAAAVEITIIEAFEYGWAAREMSEKQPKTPPLSIKRAERERMKKDLALKISERVNKIKEEL